MAIINVQGKRRTGTSGTLTITMDATPIAGNVLVLAVGITKATAVNVSGITETNVTWALATKTVGATPQAEIWYGIVGANPSASIVITMNTTYDGVVGDVYEYSGLDTAALLDKVKYTTGGTGTNLVTGTTATTTYDKELLVGCCVIKVASQATPKSEFTLYDGAEYGVLLSVSFLELVVTSKAAYSSGTTGSASKDWDGCIATFKENLAQQYTHTFTDCSAAVDTKTRFKAMSHVFTQVVKGVDSFAHQITYHISHIFTQGIGALDSKSKFRGYVHTFTSKISSLDTYSRVASFHRVFTQAVGGLESKTRIAIRFRSFAVNLASKDSFGRVKAIYRTFTTQAVGAKDTMSRFKRRIERYLKKHIRQFVVIHRE